MAGIVAIVGRPNVGKSTIFNRLQGERKAIVDDSSGVTRDRHYGTTDWGNREFTIIDTGGYVTNSNDVFEKSIRDQVEIAISEADLVVFMVDVTTGVTDLDERVFAVKRILDTRWYAIKIHKKERIIDKREWVLFMNNLKEDKKMQG